MPHEEAATVREAEAGQGPSAALRPTEGTTHDAAMAHGAHAPRPASIDEAERLRRHERDMRLAFRGLMA